MAGELEYPRFKPGDLSPSRWELAMVASAAFMASDLEILFAMLREEAVRFLVHTKDDEWWCLHLPEILGVEEQLQSDNLPLLLQAGIAHTLKYQQDKEMEALNN